MRRGAGMSISAKEAGGGNRAVAAWERQTLVTT